MDFNKLRNFIVAAEELHFTRAAERLEITQPSLSEQINILERELGTRLFVRSNRRIVLTPAGQCLLTEGRNILLQINNAKYHVQQVTHGITGELRLGLTRSSMVAGHIPQAIVRFKRKHPQIHLDISEMNSLQQEEALLHGKIDIAIIRSTETKNHPDFIRIDFLYPDNLMLVVSDAHLIYANYLKNNKKIKASTLKNELFVLFDESVGSALRGPINEIFSQSGFSPQVVQKVKEGGSMLALIAAGLGISLLPASYAKLKIENLRFLPLDSPQTVSGMYFVYHQDRNTMLIKHFHEYLKQCCHDIF